MDIINLTPHTLNILDEAGKEVARIAPSGTEARVAAFPERVGEVNGIPLFVTRLGDIEGLPEPEEDTIFVVSGLFRSACPRPDLWQPGKLIRDENNRVVACIGLSQ